MYKTIAIALYAMPHREVSLALVAKACGALPSKTKPKVSKMASPFRGQKDDSSFSGNFAERQRHEIEQFDREEQEEQAASASDASESRSASPSPGEIDEYDEYDEDDATKQWLAQQQGAGGESEEPPQVVRVPMHGKVAPTRKLQSAGRGKQPANYVQRGGSPMNTLRRFRPQAALPAGQQAGSSSAHSRIAFRRAVSFPNNAMRRPQSPSTERPPAPSTDSPPAAVEGTTLPQWGAGGLPSAAGAQERAHLPAKGVAGLFTEAASVKIQAARRGQLARREVTVDVHQTLSI